MQTKRKTLRIILLSFLILIFLVLLVLPGIVRRTLVSNSKEWFGRTIELEGLKINYFTSTIRLRNFKMFEANDRDVFMKFDTLIIDAEIWSLIKSELIIEKVYLSGSDIHIIQYDSLFNFTSLVEYHLPTDTVDEYGTDTTSSSFNVQLSNIEMHNGSISFEDAGVDDKISLKGIDLFIPYFGMDEKIDRASGMKFYLENGGFIQTNVDWDPISKNLEGKIIVDRLDLFNFYVFSKKYANLGSLEGAVNATINVYRPTKDIQSLWVDGLVDVENFSTTSIDGDTLAEFENLHIKLSAIKPLQNHFLIDSVILAKPKILFEIYDSIRNNFGDIVLAPVVDTTSINKETTSEYQANDTSTIYYSVNSFILKDGIFDFVDKTTTEPFRYHLSGINSKVDRISSDATWINLIASMKLNNRGDLQAELSFNPLNPFEIELYYVISDFQLSDLNIYSTHYAGLPILYGDMYYKSETTIHDGILNSHNKLILEDVEMGEQSAGIINLPIRFALFILKDSNGDIVLDIPVEGNINEPGLNVRKIVWNTFKGFIGKIAASPFKALGNLFGIDPTDIKEIEYSYMDTLLTDKKINQLNQLLKLESKKEDLGIELVYFNDIVKEKEAIAMELVGQKYNSNKKNYLEDEQQFLDYVREKTKNDTIRVELACLQLADLAKVDTLLNEFKKARLNSVEKYLKSQNDSTMIEFYIPDSDAPKNVGSKPVFEIKYSMKEKEKSTHEE